MENSKPTELDAKLLELKDHGALPETEREARISARKKRQEEQQAQDELYRVGPQLTGPDVKYDINDVPDLCTLQAVCNIPVTALKGDYTGESIMPSFEANILIRSKKDAMLIPRNYLLNDSIVVTESGEQRVVKTGLKDYQMIEILSGLDTNSALILPEQ